MAERTTVIRNADYVVAWNGAAESHEYLTGADLAFRGRDIVFVGKGWKDKADSEIDGRGKMLIPGLVNVHSHPSSEPANKGLLEELGSPGLGQSSLYEFMPVFRIAPEAAAAATRVAMAELLQSGVTTICDLSLARPGWADDLAGTGIRAVLCPMFRSASWRTDDGHSVTYQWDKKAGERALATALETIDRARQHPSGRVGGILGPSQIDTCTEGLLKDARDEAKRRGVPIQLHAAQSLVEFNEITRRHGKTPIEWLDSLGLLGPDLVIGHGIFLNDHPWVKWPHADDFRRLAASGAQVAHCPTVFARRGIALNTLGRYMDAGIACGIGTDTFPHNMVDELRTACYAGRVLAGNFKSVSTAHVFTAATVGGAAMLRRPDIGRLAVGAKADFSVVDLRHPYMRPVREPLRSLVYSAGERAIRDVYVDGAQVVREGRVLTVDVEAALQTLAEAQAGALEVAPGRDWAKRRADQMSPMVFPLRS
ncbi:MAG: amidohydrolase family protein [Alphaproteobacteria bacterium]|nr:amidohydrolase family protein [Alphaproteobacteria bacterium]